MILLIAGGRDYRFTPADIELLDSLHALTPVLGVVHGAAPGADAEAAAWAEALDITSYIFPADWVRYGHSAGPRRNRQMADYLSELQEAGGRVAVLLFPGGRGTDNMRMNARRALLPVFEAHGDGLVEDWRAQWSGR